VVLPAAAANPVGKVTNLGFSGLPASLSAADCRSASDFSIASGEEAIGAETI